MDFPIINHAGVTPSYSNPLSANPISANRISTEQRELIRALKSVDLTELFGTDSEFKFLLDSGTKKVIVQIVNRQTGETQQIPAPQVLRMADELDRG